MQSCNWHVMWYILFLYIIIYENLQNSYIILHDKSKT